MLRLYNSQLYIAKRLAASIEAQALKKNKLIMFPALLSPSPDSKRAGVHREELMKQYDTTFIIDGTLDLQQREKLISRFENSLHKLGCTVNRVVRWGMRDLAYEINKQKHCYYVIFYYSADPSSIDTFENQLRLNERVLRFMTIAYEGKHPDYIRDEVKQVEDVTIDEEPVEVSGLEAGEIPVSLDENSGIGDELVETGEVEEDSESMEDTLDDNATIDENNVDTDSPSDDALGVAGDGDTENKENDHAEN